MATDNGLSANGLSANGLSSNGLSPQGVSYNGLATQGLTNDALTTDMFRSWFLGQQGGTAYANMVMRYVVKCALPAGDIRSVSIDHTAYVWAGGLGLAPQWAQGQPIPTDEQQLVTACMAAHVNKYGLDLGISILGYKSVSSLVSLLSIGAAELTDYSVREGCFFGNIFNGDGAFVGSEQVWSATYSSSRACAFSQLAGNTSDCPPMILAGYCANLCTPDATGLSYSSCTYNKKSYIPLNTRISGSQVYRCGDGTCQISESCGSGSTRDSCKDCGPCQ